MEQWINGGFFFLEPEALAYLDEDSVLEREPLEGLAADGRLAGYRHAGLLGLHGHLQGRGPAQRPVGARARRPGGSGRRPRCDEAGTGHRRARLRRRLALQGAGRARGGGDELRPPDAAREALDAGDDRDRGRGRRGRRRSARRRAARAAARRARRSTRSSTSAPRRSSAPCRPIRSAASTRTCAAPGCCCMRRRRPASSASSSPPPTRPTARTTKLPYREDFALQPTAPYEASKSAADLIARTWWPSYGLPVAVTRFANIYGGGDLNFSRLVPGDDLRGARRPRAGAALRRQPGPRSALRRGRGGGLSGDRRQPATATRSAARPSTPAASAPTRCSRSSRRSPAWRGPASSPTSRATGNPEGEIDRQYVDAAKILRLCDWSPQVSLEEGLERAIGWYRDHPEVRP